MEERGRKEGGTGGGKTGIPSTRGVSHKVHDIGVQFNVWWRMETGGSTKDGGRPPKTESASRKALRCEERTKC